MKSLYAYFGLLDLHDIDSPGHSLYQIGLIDSLRENFGEEKFDFYSYYPEEIIRLADRVPYPDDTKLGDLFSSYCNSLIEHDFSSLVPVLEKIKNREYSKLYLKARFRNLSTLSKKWKDALEFEKIIDAALSSGYSKEEIVILDTDLSLPEKFYSDYSNSVEVKVVSIDFPGISSQFLKECVQIHQSSPAKHKNSIVYYGNIDTSSYKQGNSKSQILGEVLDHLKSTSSGLSSRLAIISKDSDLRLFPEHVTKVSRKNRKEIWKTLAESTVMLNVTKEKYDEFRFIPARIYEAMIFGMVPVSYKFDFLCRAFSFETLEDFQEIMKYLEECTPEDLKKAYLHFIESYLKYSKK